LRKENEKVAGVFPLPPYFYEISEKAQKSLIREQKVFFQSSLYRGRR
jgi:hypothetical protein